MKNEKKLAAGCFAILILLVVFFQNCQGTGFNTQTNPGSDSLSSSQTPPAGDSTTNPTLPPPPPPPPGSGGTVVPPPTTTVPSGDSNNMLTWAHSQLPEKTYVAVHAETFRCSRRLGIARYYQEGLGRSFSESEMNFHLSALQNGATLKNIRENFAKSAEFQNPNVPTSTFIGRLYRLLFHREPIASELSYYQDQLSQSVSRTQIVTNFLASAEHQSAPECPQSEITWDDVTDFYQPFKSAVDESKKLIFWRKDDMADYYGEIFTYDQNYIYLRAETFPVFKGLDPENTWDARPDKFRLFAATTSDVLPGRKGRLISNLRVDSSWSHSGTIYTYACYSYLAFDSGSCQLFQNAFNDHRIFIERYQNFSTVFDGENPNTKWAASSEMRTFDEVVVWNQEMDGGRARERFFFAKKNGVYYGIVRWDNAIFDAAKGRLTVIDRTVGLNLQTNPTFSFQGIKARPY